MTAASEEPLPASPDELMMRIGLARRFFTQAQWKEAQKRAGRGPVGPMLVAIGAIARDRLGELEQEVGYRTARSEDKELARVILDSGYATERAVEAALAQQKELFAQRRQLVRMGALLVQQGLLTEPQHLAAKKIRDIARASLRPPTDPDSSEN